MNSFDGSSLRAIAEETIIPEVLRRSRYVVSGATLPGFLPRDDDVTETPGPRIGGEMAGKDDLSREVLPIPDRMPVGLTTYDAKDPDTHPPAENQVIGVLGRVIDVDLQARRNGFSWRWRGSSGRTPGAPTTSP